MLAQSDERLLHQTTSLCSACKNALPAQVVATPNDEVWMRKRCPEHGAQQVRLSTSAAWYERTRGIEQRRVPPQEAKKRVDLGCPFDCGPCTEHTQKVRLPVVTITSACNLDCPICYVHNKNDDAFHMGEAEFARVLAQLTAAHGELDILNMTGGEPTMHPRFLEFVEQARAAGVHRVTLCTNGIRLAKDERLVTRVAELGARVALSFDSFEEHADVMLQGLPLLETKMRCLEMLEKHDVDTTLIPVMTRGVNEQEIGRIIAFALEKPNVRHVEVHTMTYTGQSGASFPRSGRISMLEVLECIEQTTEGLLKVDDFISSPCAHPLCYQIAYLLIDPDGGAPIPFTHFMSREQLYEALSDRLYLEPTPALERAMSESINRLWVEGGDAAERTLRLLKRLLRALFPSEGAPKAHDTLRAAERAVKAIYVHSHMDEETFDTERAAACCDSNCYADGSTIPVCNYNVLYREKEARFNVTPQRWNERSGGPKSVLSLPIVRG
ncbi:MAG: MoaA/NifB/PqqE family protein [Myxococcaceae bacterium]|nr:MoaA/NifB/PqqE family protein [Myxococcaceae bacterium]